MRFETTNIPGLIAIRLERSSDARGSFARLFCRDEFANAGLATSFVQASLSVTRQAGSLRGMHYQCAPHREIKLVRCVRGSIYDVVVDMRPQMPSYRSWQAFTLSAESDLSLYIPEGCAHGFQSLVDDVEILYQMSVPYAPEAARGFQYDDQAVGIEWPRPVTIISDKDRTWPDLPQDA